MQAVLLGELHCFRGTVGRELKQVRSGRHRRSNEGSRSRLPHFVTRHDVVQGFVALRTTPPA